ncbi:hypothetical protein WISP_78355 [Willisornis vidua]|uniref:Uncharacterized protein n=1 Tax=Willisornis vidua TaxID=1566151 RepID=A0ABQ9D5H4_9PASS|nr:hypothetical protein WISP_78355 [Willisornis vidua]
MRSYRLGAELLESGSEEKDLGGGAGRQLVEHEPAVCPGGQEGQWHPGLNQNQCGQQGQGSDPRAVLGTDGATP